MKKPWNSSLSSIALVSLMVCIALPLFSICDEPGSSYDEDIDEDIYDSDIYNRESLKMNFILSNVIDVVPTSSDYTVSNVKAKISYFPKADFRQEVISLTPSPNADVGPELVEFSWNSPGAGPLVYRIDSVVLGTNKLKEISSRVVFPVQDYNPELSVFVSESESVDFKDRRIVNIASELAGGEDDLYVVVHKFAEWVHNNIEYDLNTLTADASQKASWVLDNRMGVCDEITNLFIALCRSVNIPARFVSGLSYTNSEQFTIGWTPHGWAEVYFPGHGWIPFDVTFGEFGYVDSTHIMLKESVDANKSSSNYEWEGRNVNLNTGKIDVRAEVLERGEVIEPMLEIDTDIVYDKTGFGSYNIVEVTLTNPNNCYVPAEVTISRTKELEIFEEYSRYVLMKPYETKKIYWIFRVASGLNTRYIYNFTISATTNRGASSADSFISAEDNAFYSLDDVRSHIDAMMKSDQKEFSNDMDVSCTVPKESYIVGETAQISCRLKNKGNVMLVQIKSCLSDNCILNDLRIGEEKIISFEYLVAQSGVNKITITNDNTKLSKECELVIPAFQSPELALEIEEVPSAVDYNEGFKIIFNIRKNNSAQVLDLDVALFCPGFSEEWSQDALTGDKRYILNVAPGSITMDSSQCYISLSYKDGLGRAYEMKEDFLIEVSGIGLIDRLTIWLNNLAERIIERIIYFDE
ncbi:hypothetical protein JXB31_05485 [Candidatus Woesearchaeota archaeon]|nr:hypothetical protein [Candidatus Woesearchaeota archaeon]